MSLPVNNSPAAVDSARNVQNSLTQPNVGQGATGGKGGGQPATGGKGGGNVFQQASQGQTAAMAGTAQGMGYTPAQVQAGTLPGTDLNQYMNPFENQVVGQSLNDIEQARQMQANQLASQAQRAGAFGGSRSAILESTANEAAMQQAAQTAANLRMGGFQNAQNMAQMDLNRQFQAQSANQQAGLGAAGLRLGAAGQLGSLANQGFNMGRMLQSDMAASGAMQRQLQQDIFDRGREQFAGYQGFPERSLGYLATALGATPVPQSQTTSRQPGLFDYLGLGASLLSDRRLKKEINEIGSLPNGQKVYTWTWNEKANEIGLEGSSTGVIADECDPAIVSRSPFGYDMVDYGRLLSSVAA